MPCDSLPPSHLIIAADPFWYRSGNYRPDDRGCGVDRLSSRRHVTSDTPVRTLVVDDSDFFAQMTAETLAEDHGQEAIAVASASEALALLDERDTFQLMSRDITERKEPPSSTTRGQSR
jgi:hypothetical protein